MNKRVLAGLTGLLAGGTICFFGFSWPGSQRAQRATFALEDYRAPAGDRPALRNPNGTSILPNGRLITPIGQTALVAPHPYGLCLRSDGDLLVASCSGTGPFTLEIFERPQTSLAIHHTVPVQDAFMGLAFSPDGDWLYAAGGDRGNILRYNLRTQQLASSWNLDGPTDGHEWRHSYAGDIALSPNGRYLYVVDQANFRLVVMDVATGKALHSVPTGRYPFGLALTPKGDRLWVVNVGMFAYSPIPEAANGHRGLPFPPFAFGSKAARDGVKIEGRFIPGLANPNVPESFSVWGFDVSNPPTAHVVQKIKTSWLVGQMTPQGFPAVGGSAPSAVVTTENRIFVSNANNDMVQAFDVSNGKRLWSTLITLTPATARWRGVMPFGLALSPDENRLYVAETGINAVGILDAHTGRVLGHLPVAWWPAKLQISGDGKTLFVACSKGFGSGPNAGPNFHEGPEGTYVGNLLKGVIERISLPPDSELTAYTHRVLENNGLLPHTSPEATALPSLTQLRSHIKYVVMIVKENRTFDEVFGALPNVNGLQELARFGAPTRYGPYPDVIVMPNHLALARRFALSDNFYTDGDVSADGHRWLVGVYPNPWMATNYVQAYGGHSTFGLDEVGRRALFGSNASLAPEDYLEAGSIWDNLARHHVPFRNYGEGFEFAGVEEDAGEKPTGAIETVNIPMPAPLFANTCRTYPQFNLNIPDQYRVDQFLADWKANGFDDPARMPRFLYFHLPNDHGAEPRPKDGYPFHASYQADNDYALGRLIAFFSRTPYWKQMAIFVTEDDSQSGVDHVDAHRSICLVISPWVKPGYVSHQHTSIASILKTEEELLGLPPLNLYDALATDLRDCFGNTPNVRPYTPIPVDKRIFDPARAKDPKDPTTANEPPGPAMDDPEYIMRSLARQSHTRER